MTQIAWSIFLAACICADAVRVMKYGVYYETQGAIAFWIGIALSGLIVSSIRDAMRS